MFGFLGKILVVAALVVGVIWYFGMRKGGMALGDTTLDPQQLMAQLPLQQAVLAQAKNIDPTKLGTQLSAALDALVTHPGRNTGPVVLGVKVSNDTIGTVTDVLMGLPSEQLDQVKSVICTP